MKQIKTIPVWDVKKVNQSPKSSVRRNKIEKNSSLHEFDKSLSIEERRTYEILQKYKWRVILRQDNVKDDQGTRAVFTEQDTSASQMTTATFLDFISKFHGMIRETSDAISVSKVKMSEVPRLTQLSNEKDPEIDIAILPRRRSNSWNNIEHPVIALERNLWCPP